MEHGGVPKSRVAVQADHGRGLRAADRRRDRRAHLAEGVSPSRRARGPGQLDLLRWRGRRAPVRSHVADEQRRHQDRLAGAARPAGLLQRHQEDAQCLAGRRYQSDGSEAANLRGSRLRKRGSQPPRPRHHHRPRPAAVAVHPALPEESTLGLALPHRPHGSAPAAVGISEIVHRAIRCGRAVAARIRAEAGRAATFHHAGHQPVLDHEQGAVGGGDSRSTGALRNTRRSPAGRAGVALRQMERPTGRHRRVSHRAPTGRLHACAAWQCRH